MVFRLKAGALLAGQGFTIRRQRLGRLCKQSPAGTGSGALFSRHDARFLGKGCSGHGTLRAYIHALAAPGLECFQPGHEGIHLLHHARRNLLGIPVSPSRLPGCISPLQSRSRKLRLQALDLLAQIHGQLAAGRRVALPELTEKFMQGLDLVGKPGFMGLCAPRLCFGGQAVEQLGVSAEEVKLESSFVESWAPIPWI